MSENWTTKAEATREAKEQAREALAAAGARRRRAIQELQDSREALLTLAQEIADSGLLPKAQIAVAADISRNKLYNS